MSREIVSTSKAAALYWRERERYCACRSLTWAPVPLSPAIVGAFPVQCVNCGHVVFVARDRVFAWIDGQEIYDLGPEVDRPRKSPDETALGAYHILRAPRAVEGRVGRFLVMAGNMGRIGEPCSTRLEATAQAKAWRADPRCDAEVPVWVLEIVEEL